MQEQVKTEKDSDKKSTKKSENTTFWAKLANALGALGYTSLATQWLCVFLAIAFPYIQNSRHADLLLPSDGDQAVVQQEEQPNQQLEHGKVEGFVPYIAALLLMLSLGFGAYYFVKGIGSSGQRVMRRASEAVAERVVSHKKPRELETKEIKSCSIRISWLAKSVLLLAPPFLLFIPLDSSVEVEQSLVVFAGSILATATLLWFLAQFLIVRLAHLDESKVW